MKASSTQGYRGSGTWLRFAPTLVVAGLVHLALFFPQLFGSVDPPAPPDGGGQGMASAAGSPTWKPFS